MVPLYKWHLENGTYALGAVAGTEEQNKVISDHTDLFTYMDEQIKGFMTGVRNISEWDDFVATCESMGLDDVTKVYQERHDAYRAIMN